MNDIRSKAAVIVFTVVLFIFIIGGYITMTYMLNRTKEQQKEEGIVEVTDHRIDNTKAHIYFDTTEEVIKSYAIGYPTVVINYESTKEIESKLNTEVLEYSKTVVNLTDENKPEEELKFSNEENVLSLKYKNYEIIEYSHYITLIDEDFSYSAVNFVAALGVDSFTLDKKTGNIISEEELLNKYAKTLDEIKVLIKEKLTTLNLEENTNKIDETINNLDYTLYINKLGKLEIRYLVKSTNQDYYDKIVM